MLRLRKLLKNCRKHRKDEDSFDTMSLILHIRLSVGYVQHPINHLRQNKKAHCILEAENDMLVDTVN